MSMFALAGLMVALSGQTASPQDNTQLPEVEVRGQADRDAAREFVGRVAAPATNRRLARWRGPVCPGVVNLRVDVAQPILDRIGEVAASLDVPVGQPGCRANLVVIFTNDADGVAGTMIDDDPRLFRIGVGGLDRGGRALDRFRSSDRPVRWWQLSMPIDPRTGTRAARVPGEDTGMTIDADIALAMGDSNATDSVLGAAPVINMTGSSRLTSPTVDALYKTIVIVDVARIGVLDAGRLGDYLAMIGLAQIDDEAETEGFDTVLNLFTVGSDGLTDWDRAYLSSLYGEWRDQRSANAQTGAIAGAMRRQQ